MPDLLTRATIALFLAASVTVFARRRRMLAPSGAIAAVILGTGLVAFGGWWSGVLIVVFFLSSSPLSHANKNQAIDQARGDERDAIQVAANGGVALASAIVYAVTNDAVWLAALMGSIAGATADTWSTEIGRTSRTPPRLITSLRRVPRGTSGAISARGLLGALLGGTLIGLTGWIGTEIDLFPAFENPARLVIAAGIAGLAGSLYDSLLGATIQERRYCQTCNKPTEAHIHGCGSPTAHTGGIPGFNNDVVNLLCAVLAAVVCSMLV